MCGSRYSVRGLLYALCAMPANLSPEYKKAEQAFPTAREPRERLDLPQGNACARSPSTRGPSASRPSRRSSSSATSWSSPARGRRRSARRTQSIARGRHAGRPYRPAELGKIEAGCHSEFESGNRAVSARHACRHSAERPAALRRRDQRSGMSMKSGVFETQLTPPLPLTNVGN